MTPDDIKRRLEEAGKTLMMLPMPVNGAPAGQRSQWPEVVRTYQEWFIAQVMADKDNIEEMMAGRNAVRVKPQQKQMDRLDEALNWLWYIEDRPRRGVVTLRSLRHPVSDKHVYGWRRIARKYRMHENTIRLWYDKGIDDIRKGLALQLCA